MRPNSNDEKVKRSKSVKEPHEYNSEDDDDSDYDETRMALRKLSMKTDKYDKETQR